MARVKCNFAVIIIAIYFQLILINSEVNIEKDAVTELSIQKHDDEDPIKLSGFMCVMIETDSDPSTCDMKNKFSLAMKNGCTDLDPKKSSCPWTIYNHPHFEPSTIFHDDGACKSCHCTDIMNTCAFEMDENVINKFSPIKQESDTANNKIITGLKFKLVHNVIHFQIQQAKLLSNGKLDTNVEWSEIIGVDKYSHGKTISYDDHPLIISIYNLKLNLDEIFLPDNYVVTGVRFAKIDSTMVKSPGIKLEIKGTKFDFSNYELIKDSDSWFDSENNNGNSSSSYTRKRRGVSLINRDNPELAPNNSVMPDTNRFIKFRITDLKKAGGKDIIPYLSGKISGSGFEPLRGIGLSYKTQPGYGGYIFIKVFRHYGIISIDENNTEIETETKTETKEPGKNSSVRCDCQLYFIVTLVLSILLQ